MKHIHLLDSDTINKIAAGEVVERPASVVKELVENAIDAKSGAITVEIKDGGISLIRVTDNGSGIEKEDIETAFERHATSKIETAVDLMTVGSLGFRGEALSSIVSVAQVELITKTHSELIGTRYCADGGVKKSLDAVGCPDGTTMIVRNLFYNTPARRKFLKTAATEAGYVGDLVARLSLSRPDISFKFINNGQNKLHTSGNANLKDIIYQVYGRDVTAQLLNIQMKTELLEVTGYIGKPILSRGNRNWENYFINGRYIKSSIITRAIEDAYKTFVMVHKYPFTALHINISPSLIDVNVHPRKMEVRFGENEAVYQQIYDLIRSVLEQRELIPSVSLEKKEKESIDAKEAPEPFELQRLLEIGSQKEEWESHTNNHLKVKEQSSSYITQIPTTTINSQSFQESQDSVPVKGRQTNLFEEERLLMLKERLKHRLIGQVFGTYWLIEYDGKLFIIDQHAAHEKILYEQFVHDFEQNNLHRQILSPPVIVSLSLQEETMFRQYADYFEELGFDIEFFGGKEYAIGGVPLQLYGMNAKDIFIEILDSLSDESHKQEGSAITYYIATMACKAAVKGNHTMSSAEADALIDRLLEAENPYTCPHGRPTIISISKYEMEKKFKRIQ